MAAFDARHIDEARRATHQGAAGKDKLRHRLPAALGDCARAVAEPLTAREGVAHQRMSLEALEFLERREVRFAIVKMNNKPARDQIVVIRIEKRAAAGSVAERPAERVLHEPALE